MTETVIAGGATAAATQTLVMSVLGVMLAGTVLWRLWQAGRGRPRRREREVAEQRAADLMYQVRGEQTYAAVLSRGYLDVPSHGDTSGRRVYRITYPPDGVLVLENGVPREHLCLVPRDWVPAADVFLTHKTLLEGDEEDYLCLAVHTPLPPGMILLGES